MPALMIGCPTAGNVLVQLDDPSVVDDEGVAFEAYAITNPIDFGLASGMGRFRRVVQMVTLGGPSRITLTPFGDGDEFDTQAVAVDLDPVNGTTQVVQLEPAVDGHRFQYKMDASNRLGAVAFGEADLQFVPKRMGK